MARQKTKNRRKKYTLGGVRKPRRVQKYYGGVPDILYDDSGKPYILNSDGSKNYLNTSGGTARPITSSKTSGSYVPRLDEFNPEDYATMTQEDRIAQLMARGQTEEQARKNQQRSLDRGYDINQDGVVTDQEFAALRDAQKTKRAGEAGFDPAKFTSEKRGSIGYDPSAGYTTKKPEPPVIKKTEPIKYETLPSQPIPEEAILDESKVFIEEPKKEEDDRVGARQGGRQKRSATPPKTGGARKPAPPKTGGARPKAPPKRPTPPPPKRPIAIPTEVSRPVSKTPPKTGGARPSRPAVELPTEVSRPVSKTPPKTGGVRRPAPKTPARPIERELMQNFQKIENFQGERPTEPTRPTRPAEPIRPEPLTPPPPKELEIAGTPVAQAQPLEQVIEPQVPTAEPTPPRKISRPPKPTRGPIKPAMPTSVEPPKIKTGGPTPAATAAPTEIRTPPESAVLNTMANFIEMPDNPPPRPTGGPTPQTPVDMPTIDDTPTQRTVTSTDVQKGTATTATAPADIEAQTYEATTVADQVQDVADVEGELSKDAIATIEDQELTERAVAAKRNRADEAAAKAVAAQRPEEQEYAQGITTDERFKVIEAEDPEVATRVAQTISNRAQKDLMDIVTGEGVNLDDIPEFKLAEKRTAQVAEAQQGIAQDLGNAPSVDLQGRQAITGEAPKGDAAQIGGVPTMAAAERQAVTGKARRAAAADMNAVVGNLPPKITAAILDDPQTVEAQLDTQPVAVKAAVAALPKEALVSTQMEGLLAGMEDGKVPVWAKPAVDAINAQMASRGLSASTVGRDALFNAIIQSALPIAQSNAQALQQRATQNLSNEQQANLQQASQVMQQRMANLSNRQTAASQTAQMAQEINVRQAEFEQQAVLTGAQQEQQVRMQNLQNAQQRASQESAQRQQTALANLNAERRMDLANLDALNQAGAQKS